MPSVVWPLLPLGRADEDAVGGELGELRGEGLVDRQVLVARQRGVAEEPLAGRDVDRDDVVGRAVGDDPVQGVGDARDLGGPGGGVFFGVGAEDDQVGAGGDALVILAVVGGGEAVAHGHAVDAGAVADGVDGRGVGPDEIFPGNDLAPRPVAVGQRGVRVIHAGVEHGDGLAGSGDRGVVGGGGVLVDLDRERAPVHGVENPRFQVLDPGGRSDETAGQRRSCLAMRLTHKLA